MTQPTASIPGIKLLLEGAPGSGKTAAIETWITGQTVTGKCLAPQGAGTGISVCAIFTEPSFDVVATYKCPLLHWRYIPPMSEGFSDMLDTLTKIHSLSRKSLADLSFDRSRHGQALDLIRACNDFKCDRCGQSLGPVDLWGTDRVLWVDSLSGLNPMFMSLVVGGNPMKDQGQWGMAMEQEEKFLNKLCFNTRCHLVVTSHLDRETDQVTGQSRIFPAALGSKLGPKIPRFFTDVVLAQQVGGKFTWSTAASGAELKARNLPLADNLPPNIDPALKAWTSRGGTIG